MSCLVIFCGLGLFLLCLGLHLLLWRCRVPYMSSLLLLVIFFAPAAAIVLYSSAGAPWVLPLTMPEILAALLLHASLAAAYIASYPAVRAVSPSLDILLIIESSRDKKITREELKKKFSDIRLVHARIDDLKDYHFMIEQGDRFCLASAGKAVVALFTLYRRLLGLPQGEG